MAAWCTHKGVFSFLFDSQNDIQSTKFVICPKAVIGGDWLLFEDIDTATSDVVTLLVSLIERNSLSVPGFRDNITPAPGFQMFFTQRFISSISGYFQQNSLTSELLRRHWVQLNVEPLTKQELIQLIQIKVSSANYSQVESRNILFTIFFFFFIQFPILKTISSRMVDAYLLFSVGLHKKDDGRVAIEASDITGSKGRLTSTR